jgi:hypothetical protein
MSSFWTQRNLLALLMILVFIRFGLVPLIEWQDGRHEQLERKLLQYEKIVQTIESVDVYTETLADFNVSLERASNYFYADSDRAKLEVQKEIEEVFLVNDLVIKEFNWVIDSNGPVRTLRASVRFSGSIQSMIKTFWGVERLPRLVRVMDWEQRVDQSSDQGLGLTSGRVTLEAYALVLREGSPDLEQLLDNSSGPISGAQSE